MKLGLFLVCLSVVVMVAMIYQSVRQELDLRNLKTRVLDTSAEVKRKEETVVTMRGEVRELKATLASVNAEMEKLKKKKADAEKSKQEFDKSLESCNSEKADVENKKKNVAEAMTNIKADHEKVKKKAEEDIQSLKQQILDRDKAICAFADMTKEEARKLCGISEAPKKNHSETLNID